jgi:hypothetical protein
VRVTCRKTPVAPNHSTLNLLLQVQQKVEAACTRKMADPKGVGFPKPCQLVSLVMTARFASRSAPAAFPQTTGCSPD